MKKPRTLLWGTCMLMALFFLFAVTGPVPAETVSVAHDLDVTLFPDTQRLAGVDRLSINAPGGAQLVMTLAAGARIHALSVAGQAVPYNFKNGRLRMRLPHGFGRGEIEVSYEAAFQDPVPADPVHTEDPGYGVTGVISAQGVFLLPGAGWYPHVPGSRPTFRLQVQAPAGYEAVTAGKRVLRETKAERSISVWEVPHARGGLSLSAGRYVVRAGDAAGIPVYTYFFPEDDHLAPGYMDAVARYLRMYTDLFGPYPFEKFAVVENFFPTGYGFPSYTLLGRTVIRLPFIVETSLGHEVAHGWWGNGVLVDYDKGNWCEGLTSYVADYLFKEQSSAEEARDYRLKVLRDYATLVSPEADLPLAAFVSRVSPSTRAVGYGKAAMVFHMARRIVGNEAFWAGLRRVFEKKLFQEASWDDFCSALGRAGGRDLEPFFAQWVARPGAPVLWLEDAAVRPQGQGWRVTGRLRQKAPFFDLPVLVRVETGGPAVDAVVRLSKEAAPLNIYTGAYPKRLVVDPEVDLFRRLDPAEVPPVVNGVKGSDCLVVVASRALPAEVLESAGMVLKALGQDDAPIISEDDTKRSRVKGRDILYIGIPAGQDLEPKLPEGFALSRDSFAVEGVVYEDPRDALFAVFPHPHEPEQVAGLFLPLSGRAALKAARKIPHYGKYSYLVFRDGTNQAKGTWPVSASPLVHSFVADLNQKN